ALVGGAREVVVKAFEFVDEPARHSIFGIVRRTVDASRQKRHRAASVRPDETDIRKSRRIAAEGDARDGARRISAVLNAAGCHAVPEILAAVRGRWMDVDDRV